MVEISLARVIKDFEDESISGWSVVTGTATIHNDGAFPCRGAKSLRTNITVGSALHLKLTFSPTVDWSNFSEFIATVGSSKGGRYRVVLKDAGVGYEETIIGWTTFGDKYKYALIKRDISAYTRTQIEYITFQFDTFSSLPADCFVDDILLSRKNDNYITFDPKPRVWNIDLTMRTPQTPIPNRVGGILQGVGSENQRFTVDGIMKKGTTHASSYYYLLKKLQSYAQNNNIVVLSDATEAFIIPGMLSNVSYGRGSKKEWFMYDFDITEFTELGGEDL